MADETHRLVLLADSAQIKKAQQDLNDLGKSSAEAEAATKKLGTAT